jgi:hypothetical protein
MTASTNVPGSLSLLYIEAASLTSGPRLLEFAYQITRITKSRNLSDCCPYEIRRRAAIQLATAFTYMHV